jgi:hypothetical protein
VMQLYAIQPLDQDCIPKLDKNWIIDSLELPNSYIEP